MFLLRLFLVDQQKKRSHIQSSLVVSGVCKSAIHFLLQTITLLSLSWEKCVEYRCSITNRQLILCCSKMWQRRMMKRSTTNNRQRLMKNLEKMLTMKCDHVEWKVVLTMSGIPSTEFSKCDTNMTGKGLIFAWHTKRPLIQFTKQTIYLASNLNTI